MGYRGKLHEQAEARRLRADGRTLAEIAEIAEVLGVSKSSVSLWVRDVAFTPSPRRTGAKRTAHPFHLAKLRQIEEADAWAREQLSDLTDRELLVAGVALYAGEGAKRDGCVIVANTDPRLIALFCSWLRRFFTVDESRLRVRLYLHQGLDLDAAEEHWSAVTGIPRTQFHAAYRAAADPTRRSAKHVYGCASVQYGSTVVHRRIMGLTRALLSSEAAFRGSSIGGAAAC